MDEYPSSVFCNLLFDQSREIMTFLCTTNVRTFMLLGRFVVV